MCTCHGLLRTGPPPDNLHSLPDSRRAPESGDSWLTCIHYLTPAHLSRARSFDGSVVGCSAVCHAGSPHMTGSTGHHKSLRGARLWRYSCATNSTPNRRRDDAGRRHRPCDDAHVRGARLRRHRGDDTLTVPLNDSEAGGTYDEQFTKAYSGVTPDGTPVYIYVPEGTPLDGKAPTGVDSLDPAFDPTAGDEFVPCDDAVASDYTITQAQIDYMGDQLANQIVAVDEEHFGPMDAADPDDPASDSLVMLVYNVQDDSYYNCGEDSYTAGYFAPDLHRLGRHERHRHRRVRLGEPGRTRTTRSGATTTRRTTRPRCTKASSRTSSSTCCTTTATRASCRGSMRVSRTSRHSSTDTTPQDRT